MKKYLALSLINRNSHGFTLVEILVAVGLFSIIMMVGAGALVTISHANQKAQALKSAMNNLDFALESISRTARVGRMYHCGGPPYDVAQNCEAGGSVFAFESYNGDKTDPGDQFVFRLNGTALERSVNGGSPEDTFVRLTAPDVTITDFDVYVFGAENTDKVQPHVIIAVQGKVGVGTRSETAFSIQTSVTQRLLDLAP